ncbi:undecaprenyldiphospho-muramoylpentapeptide beta-N-acetylglucosaminyltransferase [Candidatus Paracaedibacter symbiosus]|uniref:undecaprenyldiphospho-muramoylpentapeptide beta-N-acetylglucosaminyltransferase n=1 Tax=Candidatus Paracaedibacter symbiosus TaxID=244582 RepID=UPI000509BE34|nr:undecaprenyldiphospho-muramoylpentapeptide beta-N-acetylglucosaminyltransferase [Candidatus Paracaedibacter symbiosus]
MTKQEKKNLSLRIALSTGGTGGHVFPALCLAEELLKRGHSLSWCTDQRGEKYFTSRAAKKSDKLTFYIARDSGGLLGKLKRLVTIAGATFKVLVSFLKKKPDLVVGFGGYTTAPVVVAATLLRIPIVLHEQNAVLGKVNRWMASYAKVMALGFEATQRIPPEIKTIYVGNPVRAEIMQLREKEYPAVTNKIKLLVIGGSQGAALFSRVIPEAISLLPQPLKDRLEITQQARKELLVSTREAYQKIGISATVEPFFDNMADLYDGAHLVVCRAGAMTVAEVCVSHRPAIFVPLAIAMDNHQYYNASELVDADLAWLIKEKEFTPPVLAAQLSKIFEESALLKEISQRLQKKYRLDATVRLANYLEDLLPKEKES